jgi:hypothetical protein
MGALGYRLLCVYLEKFQSQDANPPTPDMSHAASFDATSILLGAQNHYRGWLFTRMLHHPGLFHAIMAICLAQMQTLLPSADPRAPQQLAYHRGCAIAVVKHGLEDLGRLSEYAVLETIVALANVEVWQAPKISQTR